MIQSSFMLGSLWLWEVKWMISQFGRDHWFVGSGHLSNSVWLFATPWTVQARLPCCSLSPGVAQIHVHWISDAIHHLILCHRSPLFLPSIFTSFRVFPVSQLFASGVQSIGASTSVLAMNIQGWFPLVLTGLLSLLFNGLSRVFSSTTVWKHQLFSA